MKLITKTILHRKWGSMVLLVLLSFLVLLSTQITVTLYSKNSSLAQRVDEVNGAHMHVYQTISHQHFDIEKAVQGIGTYETTYAYGYHNGYAENDIFLEGYVSTYDNDQPTNAFAILEGKSLDQLHGNEVAITESYARSLRKLGLDPIGYTFSLPVYDQNQTSESFTVVSIIDYPNYNDGYTGKNLLKDIKLFDYPILSVALANYDTVQRLVEQQPNYFNRIVYKVHINNYDVKTEQQLVKRIGDLTDVYSPFEVSVTPLFEIAQLASTSDILFQFLSIFVLAGLMLSSTYTFYLFLRKQLMQDSQTIGTLVLQGISHRRIIYAYGIQLVLIVGGNLLLFGILNVGLRSILAGDRSLASILDSNAVILLRTLLLYGGYLFILSAMFTIQLRRYMKDALHMTKTADRWYPKHKNLTQFWYVFQFVWKQLLANVVHTVGFVLSITLILVTIFITVMASFSVSHIYQPDTLGVTFDYIVGQTSFEHYKMAKEMAKDAVIVDKQSNLYFLDIDYRTNKRTYYKSNYLIFYNRIEGFVSAVEGEISDFSQKDMYLDYRAYLRVMAASRRHMDLRDLYVYGTEGKKVVEQYLFYLRRNYPGDRETAAPISATVNTLIDNGWIAYDLRFYSEMDYDNVGKDVPMFLINVEHEGQGKQLEAYFQSRGIEYMSMQEVLHILNLNNQDVNHKTMVMMSAVILLLLFLWLLNEVSMIRCNVLEQAQNHQFLTKIGVRHATIRRKVVLQEIMVILISMMCSGVLFVVIQPMVREGLMKAYGLYSMPALPAYLYVWFAGILGILLMTALVLSRPVRVKPM